MSSPAAPDTLKVVATVDGVDFSYISAFTLKQTVNGARTLTCAIQETDSLELCRLGAIITLEYGRGSLVEGKKFIGIIKVINPSIGGASITAIDYISQLANSEYVNYKPQDYVGEDLYFAAAAAASYKEIDVSRLKQGTGMAITEGMSLWGYQTRKEFIDACFDELVEAQQDAIHPLLSYRPWYYAIHAENYMEFFQPDPQRTNAGYALAISEADQNITDEGIVAQIDTTQIFNSVTVVSKSDNTLFKTINDNHSIARYGVQSYKVDYDSADRDTLEGVARRVVNRYKSPTKSYSISLHAGEWLDLGNIVRITAPSLGTDETLPVVSYDVNASESLVTVVTLGERKLSISDYIKRLG